MHYVVEYDTELAQLPETRHDVSRTWLVVGRIGNVRPRRFTIIRRPKVVVAVVVHEIHRHFFRVGRESRHSTKVKGQDLVPSVAAPEKSLADLDVFGGQAFHKRLQSVAGQMDTHIKSHSERDARERPRLRVVSKHDFTSRLL